MKLAGPSGRAALAAARPRPLPRMSRPAPTAAAGPRCAPSRASAAPGVRPRRAAPTGLRASPSTDARTPSPDHTSPSLSLSLPRSRALWTPTSQSAADVAASREPAGRGVFAGQGPPPPSPMMVERFSAVVSQLFAQRVVRLGGPVDDEMANLIVAQLLYLDSADPAADVTLYVNSPGGSVTAGMAVFDTMRHVRPDVSTVCVGLAASMGAFLLASGAQGKRYSLPNSRIMIHQPLGGAQGQAADIEIQVRGAAVWPLFGWLAARRCCRAGGNARSAARFGASLFTTFTTRDPDTGPNSKP